MKRSASELDSFMLENVFEWSSSRWWFTPFSNWLEYFMKKVQSSSLELEEFYWELVYSFLIPDPWESSYLSSWCDVYLTFHPIQPCTMDSIFGPQELNWWKFLLSSLISHFRLSKHERMLEFIFHRKRKMKRSTTLSGNEPLLS